MKITILTTGTRGDIQPFIALGQGLQQQGYSVTLATHAPFQTLVESYGLSLSAIAGDIQGLLASPEGEAMLATRNPIQLIRRYAQLVQPLVARAIADSWAACQGSDVILFTAYAPWGYDMAEALGIPGFFCSLIPQTATSEFPYPTVPPSLRLGGWLNQLSYPLLMEAFGLLFHAAINQFRYDRLQLSPIPRFTLYRRFQSIPTLYGYSGTVVPKPATWGEHLHVTGYWFLDRPSAWQPDAALLDFLATGSPPVYIGFGSMKDGDPQSLIQTALAALQQTGQRGILATGWSGLTPADLPETVYWLESAPHDWLFPKMATIVHHGGAGTTAAALRAGIPSVIAPFFGDQPFWADRAKQLGVSVMPIPKALLTVDRLTQALMQTTNNPGIRERAKAIAAQIQAEDGVQGAINAIQQKVS